MKRRITAVSYTHLEVYKRQVYNIVHLIYRTQAYEGASADYEFSRATMTEHWTAGHRDATHSLQQPEIYLRPENSHGVATFDFC